MFLQILTAVLLGITSGIVTGLIPGIHVNLISIILLGLSGFLLGFTSPLILACFIIAMAVTHTFLDSIPSVFLGAPDAAMALGVLPGHKLLLEGRGFEAVKLTVIGSLICLIVTVLLIPLMLPFVAGIYEFIRPSMGYILIAVVLYMIIIEKSLNKKLFAFFVFLLTGSLGLVVLNWPNLEQPLFSMLTGLFGISTLAISLQQNSKIPKQTFTESIEVPFKKTVKAISAGVFSGSLTGIFPGLGAAQASIIGMGLVGKIGAHGFMILLGGINTVNFVFSLATLFALQKARNGAVVVVLELIKSIDFNQLMIFCSVALIAGAVATFLALKISKGFASIITKLNYRKLVLSIIIFISILVFVFSGFYGLLILVISTAIGMIAPLIGVKRSHAMGCLMLPVILFFVL